MQITICLAVEVTGSLVCWISTSANSSDRCTPKWQSGMDGRRITTLGEEGAQEVGETRSAASYLAGLGAEEMEPN